MSVGNGPQRVGDWKRRMEDMAADIYVRMIVSGRALQVSHDKLKEEAYVAAEEFYGEVPLPSQAVHK